MKFNKWVFCQGIPTEIYLMASNIFQEIKVGENCRICVDIKNIHRRAIQSALASSSNKPRIQCPPDGAILGHSTWTLLHTMAAYYPIHPTDQDRRDMGDFLRTFSRLYPCGHCAEHLRAEMEEDPPQVASRHDLSMWLCRLHNKVNEMLGKPLFDCQMVMERWHDGPADGSCDQSQ
jgi:mitochondrial FAD-linked sulfhydryl oxidase